MACSANSARPRCFVALRPDPAALAPLDALARRLQRACPGSRRVDPENFHLTLAFIGELAVAWAPQICQYLAAIRPPQFVWTIDRVACFERARVAWAGGPEPAQLAALAHKVRAGLDGLGVPYDRKAFVAHVTLLRKAVGMQAQAVVPPLRWGATPPVLMVSERDARGHVRYRPWADRAPGQG